MDRWFESSSLQRRVRRTPTRTGEVPSDLEVVRYWDLAATERPKLNRTRRSAPSSAATRTVANPGAGGKSEARNTRRVDRLGADRTVGAGRLYGHARGTGDQRLDTSSSIEPCACPSLHLLPLCCPAPLTPCLAVRKGHSRDIPMDLFTTGQVGGGMRFHPLSRSSG